jgi:hypothetical protein
MHKVIRFSAHVLTDEAETETGHSINELNASKETINNGSSLAVRFGIWKSLKADVDLSVRRARMQVPLIRGYFGRVQTSWRAVPVLLVLIRVMAPMSYCTSTVLQFCKKMASTV